MINCKDCKFWERRGDTVLGSCAKVNQDFSEKLSDSITITINKPLDSHLPFVFGVGENFGCIKGVSE